MFYTKLMRVSTGIVLVLALMLGFATIQAQDTGSEDQCPTQFHLRGTQPQTIGEYPNNFSYDGTNVVKLTKPGFFELHYNAANDTGLAFARFYVDSYQLNADTHLENAQLTVIYPLFGTPTGVMPDYWEGGVATCVLLHGDSGHEAPVLPTVWNDVASWGPVLLFVDGEQVRGADELMGAPNPMGAFAGHIMYTNPVRDRETGFVANAAGDAPYSPQDPSNGITYTQAASLLHLIAHSEERDANAFPPNTMFMHVNFFDVNSIAPLDGIQYLTKDMVQNMSPDDFKAQVGQWMTLIDGIEASLKQS